MKPHEINQPEQRIDAPAVGQSPSDLREQDQRIADIERSLDSFSFSEGYNDKIYGPAFKESDDPIVKLSEYMSSHNYGPEDYDTYSKDPEWQALQKQAFPDYHFPVIESYAIEDYRNFVDNWLKDINPNFDPYDISSPYRSNCGSCAVAVERRLNGESDVVASAENIGTVWEMERLTGMDQVPMTPNEIRDYLLEHGPGSHGIVGIDRSYGQGHWFNALCTDDSTVIAIDGQTGEIFDWPPDYGDVTSWDFSVRKEDK